MLFADAQDDSKRRQGLTGVVRARRGRDAVNKALHIPARQRGDRRRADVREDQEPKALLVRPGDAWLEREAVTRSDAGY